MSCSGTVHATGATVFDAVNMFDDILAQWVNMRTFDLAVAMTQIDPQQLERPP